MLVLSHNRLPAERVELAKGASITIRPATSSDLYLAKERVQPIAIGLAASITSLSKATEILGDEFPAAALSDQEVLRACGERIMLLELGFICAESWEGIGNPDKTPAELNKENLACVLRDIVAAEKISAVLYRRSLLEQDEGNASAASLDGGAAAVAPIALTAGPSAAAAPSDEPATAESSAPK